MDTVHNWVNLVNDPNMKCQSLFHTSNETNGFFLSSDPISDFQGQEINLVKVAREKYWVLVEVYFRGFV